MATYCAHLFWNVENNSSKEDSEDGSVAAAPMRDAKSVLDSLKRALKVADRCTPNAHAQLYTINTCTSSRQATS